MLTLMVRKRNDFSKTLLDTSSNHSIVFISYENIKQNKLAITIFDKILYNFLERMWVLLEILAEFIIFIICTFFVSICVNFLNRNDKRLPWKNVFMFATIFSITICLISLILQLLSP